MHWIMLIAAGLLEVVWAIGLKYTQGFTRLWPSVGTLAAMVASFLLLSQVVKHLPLGISYTVWVGIGAVGSVIAGVAIFGEKLSPVQVGCMVLIGAGIIGLRITHTSTPVSGNARGSLTAAP
ncbi:MAG: multidrug efflux SMR transporter [Planctomycetes bacterium]|nr:multidrug efflux SMR transporter [Planctomycetota bacterium]